MKVKCLIPFLDLVLIFGFTLACGGTSRESSEQSKMIEALVCSQIFIEDYLVSPASAEFPTISSNGVLIKKIG